MESDGSICADNAITRRSSGQTKSATPLSSSQDMVGSGKHEILPRKVSVSSSKFWEDGSPAHEPDSDTCLTLFVVGAGYLGSSA